MSYYYPFGTATSATIANISYSLSAPTGSRPQFVAIPVNTASYAVTVQNSPPNGTTGQNNDGTNCTATAPQGDRGVTGPSGSKGSNYDYCPAGTKWCPSLDASLVAVNAIRPSGSQFSIVCIETVGYIASTVTCPATLPTSPSYPVLP
jgi:hypothetical protein